jgi:hypothetical protein
MIKKFILFILLIFVSVYSSSANAVPTKHNGQGNLFLSKDIINQFIKYINTSNINNPLNFFITQDHKDVFIVIKKNANYKGYSGSGPIVRNKKKCENKFKQPCFLFSNQRYVVWNNGVNPIKKDTSLFKRKADKQEIFKRLEILGFIETSTTEKKTKIDETKNAKKTNEEKNKEKESLAKVKNKEEEINRELSLSKEKELEKNTTNIKSKKNTVDVKSKNEKKIDKFKKFVSKKIKKTKKNLKENVKTLDENNEAKNTKKSLNSLNIGNSNYYNKNLILNSNIYTKIVNEINFNNLSLIEENCANSLNLNIFNKNKDTDDVTDRYFKSTKSIVDINKINASKHKDFVDCLYQESLKLKLPNDKNNLVSDQTIYSLNKWEFTIFNNFNDKLTFVFDKNKTFSIIQKNNSGIFEIINSGEWEIENLSNSESLTLNIGKKKITWLTDFEFKIATLKYQNQYFSYHLNINNKENGRDERAKINNKINFKNKLIANQKKAKDLIFNQNYTCNINSEGDEINVFNLKFGENILETFCRLQANLKKGDYFILNSMKLMPGNSHFESRTQTLEHINHVSKVKINENSTDASHLINDIINLFCNFSNKRSYLHNGYALQETYHRHIKNFGKNKKLFNSKNFNFLIYPINIGGAQFHMNLNFVFSEGYLYSNNGQLNKNVPSISVCNDKNSTNVVDVLFPFRLNSIFLTTPTGRDVPFVNTLEEIYLSKDKDDFAISHQKGFLKVNKNIYNNIFNALKKYKLKMHDLIKLSKDSDKDDLAKWLVQSDNFSTYFGDSPAHCIGDKYYYSEDKISSIFFTQCNNNIYSQDLIIIYSSNKTQKDVSLIYQKFYEDIEKIKSFEKNEFDKKIEENLVKDNSDNL